VVRKYEIDLPLRIARGEGDLSHFVEIVIFGGQPEKDGGGDSAGLVLTLQLQHGRQFG